MAATNYKNFKIYHTRGGAWLAVKREIRFRSMHRERVFAMVDWFTELMVDA